MTRSHERTGAVVAAPGASPTASLHEQAAITARRLLERHAGSVLPEDVRSIVGHYQGACIAAERAARHLLAYAAATLDIPEGTR